MAPITEGMTEEDAMELHEFVSSCTGANISSVLMLGQARRILATHAALAETQARVIDWQHDYDSVRGQRDRLEAKLAEAQADSERLTAELQTAISVKIANAKSADEWQAKYGREDKLCQIIAGHRDDYKRERDALREAVEAYALDPDAATHFLNINPERDEPFADALLRWHASRQPDPAPGGTE